MKTPIPGSYIFIRNPWENHLGQSLYFGGSISFSNPNGSLVLYGLGGNRSGRIRVTLTILRQTWEDTCSPSEIERTVSRFFRVWEGKNPHRYTVPKIVKLDLRKVDSFIQRDHEPFENKQDPGISNNPKRPDITSRPYCERDTDGDGNCSIHSAPGLLRIHSRASKPS
jgi:hypothetical protein